MHIKSTTNVRIAGFGGQGIVKAGEILGCAAVADGKQSLQNQSYGSSARGGLCTADVIVSHGQIYEIEPESFDVLMALNQPSFDAFLPHVPKDGLIVYEADLVRPSENPPVKTVGIRATHIAAQELGRKVVANIVALGFLGAATGLLSRDALVKTVEQNVPKGTEQLNLKAFDLGWERGDRAG